MHTLKCRHFARRQGKDGWAIFQREPVEQTRSFTDIQLKQPECGLYEFEGKTYWILHTHGPECEGIHRLKGDRWVYVGDD